LKARDPSNVNKNTVAKLIEAIIGLRRKGFKRRGASKRLWT
jgi:hypothetical protein